MFGAPGKGPNNCAAPGEQKLSGREQLPLPELDPPTPSQTLLSPNGAHQIV